MEMDDPQEESVKLGSFPFFIAFAFFYILTMVFSFGLMPKSYLYDPAHSDGNMGAAIILFLAFLFLIPYFFICKSFVYGRYSPPKARHFVLGGVVSELGHLLICWFCIVLIFLITPHS